MPSQDPQNALRWRARAPHAQKAKHDSRELTKNARAASPGSLGFWEREVDPDGHLDPLERLRRANHAAGLLWLARPGSRRGLAGRGRRGDPRQCESP